MFANRDLSIMGVGALVAVALLFIPIPFFVKAFFGGAVLVFAMVVALMRLGPDKVPLEVWLHRRWKYNKSARRYTYHTPQASPSPAPPPSAPAPPSPPASPPRPSVSAQPPAEPLVALRPVSVDWEGAGVYNLVVVWLTVVGAYAVYWLQQGGADEIALLLRSLFR